MRRAFLCCSLASAAGCGDKDGEPAEPIEPSSSGWDPPAPLDADGDGYRGSEDCDDANPAINPDAAEVCDSLDNDCDGAADEVTPLTPIWYVDADGDGYGSTDEAIRACQAPPGYVAVTGPSSADCDDADPAIHPPAEACGCDDGSDNDSDGLADCEDGECAENSACVEGACEDGADEDGDGQVDCDDEDCWGTSACADVRAWVNAGRFAGSAYRHFHSFRVDFVSHSSSTSRRWSRAWSVQGSIHRYSPRLGLATTCTWTVDSASWSGQYRYSYEGFPAPMPSYTWFDLDPIARVGAALSPDCPSSLALDPYLPHHVGIGGVPWGPGWGAPVFSFGHSGWWEGPWWAPAWYRAGSWTSAQVASTAYDPGSPSDSDLWRSTHQTTWTGSLTRGDSYYTDPPW